MNKTIIGLAGFVLGAAAGSAAAIFALKKRYESIANDEIESVRSVYAQKLANKNKELKEQHDISKDESDHEEEPDDEDRKVADSMVKHLDYSTFSDTEHEKENAPVKKTVEVNQDPEEPYVITVDEYGEFADYGQVVLKFYSDGVLTDDMNDILEDPDDIVGYESLNHFGEYEDDRVFVRNDRLKCDYEILLDERTYLEAL